MASFVQYSGLKRFLMNRTTLPPGYAAVSLFELREQTGYKQLFQL